MRKLILFGMPGTGKSTAAKYISEKYIELDLGSEKLSDKQLSKIRSFTGQLLKIDFNVMSSYPLYFSDDILHIKPSHNCRIVVAIPTTDEAKELVLSRVAKRGGEYKEFLAVYEKKINQWIEDWSRKFKDAPYVERILYYNNEVNASLKKWLDTGEVEPLSKVSSIKEEE